MKSVTLDYLLWATAAPAFVTLTIITVYCVLEAANTNLPYVALSVITALMNTVALFLLVLIFVLRVARGTQQQLSRCQSMTATLCAAAAALLAASITLTALGLKVATIGLATSTERARSWIFAMLATTIISAVTQACFYAILFRFRPVKSTGQSLQASQNVEITKYPASNVHGGTLPRRRRNSSFGARNRSEPLPSLSRTSDAENSILSSQQLIRHSIVATRLRKKSDPSMVDSPLARSLRNSLDSLSQRDAFDSWDISEIDPIDRNTIRHTSPHTKQPHGIPLETIPGSRPGSPGHPLDGPFPNTPTTSVQGGDREMTLPASPSLTKTQPDEQATPSPAESTPEYEVTPSRQVSAGNTSAQPNNNLSVNEGHIHPLFRSDSPTPPPSATPGTVIHASPLGGQVMLGPPRPFARGRAASYETPRDKKTDQRALSISRQRSAPRLMNSSPLVNQSEVFSASSRSRGLKSLHSPG